ncbi:MAG: SRPBCC family protein [Acidobacteriaceae bacterium]|nr:SRPBCC family protein [Acidobacteriaceae bacterium]
MRWLIYAGIFAGAVILIVVLVGLALPRAHVISRHASYRQSPAAVYALIAGPQNWRPDVAKWEEIPNPGGRKRWKEYSGHRAVTFEETIAEEPRQYQTKIADKNLPFGGSWTWNITPTETGCDVRITEAGEVYNPIFRFVGRFIIGYDRTITDYLNALGKKFGETVIVEP